MTDGVETATARITIERRPIPIVTANDDAFTISTRNQDTVLDVTANDRILVDPRYGRPTISMSGSVPGITYIDGISLHVTVADTVPAGVYEFQVTVSVYGESDTSTLYLTVE